MGSAARRSWTLFLFSLSALSMIFICWKFLSLSATMNGIESTKLLQDMDAHMEANNHEGKNRVVQVATMEESYLPSSSGQHGSSSRRKQRLIFVGDIHGCMSELQLLLEKAKYDADTDHLIAAGDMINKGPNSVEVVEFLRQRRASCVRGNHEDKVLDLLKKSNKDDSKEAKLAASFSKSQVRYLQSCPLILRIGHLDSHGQILVAHGGLVPGVDLNAQNPSDVMNMRIINPKTNHPSKKHHREGYVHWAKAWNDYQRLLLESATRGEPTERVESSGKPTTVIYGHDAKRGLQIHKWTKGLDSGCVKGGMLTAWIVNGAGREEIVQVPCKDYST